MINYDNNYLSTNNTQFDCGCHENYPPIVHSFYICNGIQSYCNNNVCGCNCGIKNCEGNNYIANKAECGQCYPNNCCCLGVLLFCLFGFGW